MKHNYANRRGMPFSIPILNSKYLPTCRKSGLSTLLICLFSFQFVCLAQESPDLRETTGIGEIYNFDNFEDKSFQADIKYKYYYQKQNYQHTLRVDPKADLIRFPLISYSLDFASTPNVILEQQIPAYIRKIPFRYVDSLGEIKEGTLEEFSKNRLLILDFWATWCSPCVQSVQKWNEITKELPEVEVLAVMLDYDYKAQYYGLDRGWTSPIVFGPQAYILNSLFFKQTVISRMAWIKDDRLIAFTGTKDYDLQLVKDVIAGREVEIPMDLTFTYSSK